jgi:hypothetical protein
VSQKPLFDAGPPDGNLTDRQRLVLGWVRSMPGLTADEAGALLHQHAGKHGAGERCEWCTSTGREVLKALRKRDLARSNRSGEWRANHGSTSEAVEGHERYDPSTAEIPF